MPENCYEEIIILVTTRFVQHGCRAEWEDFRIMALFYSYPQHGGPPFSHARFVVGFVVVALDEFYGMWSFGPCSFMCPKLSHPAYSFRCHI